MPRLIHCVSHSLDTMQKVKKNLKEHCYTANLVPVMKTGIPCAHILTGKTCFNHKKNLITGILSTLQGTCIQNRWFHARPMHTPCSTLYEIALYFPASRVSPKPSRGRFWVLLLKGRPSLNQFFLTSAYVYCTFVSLKREVISTSL